MTRKKPIVAIDGPVGVGKSSVAFALAKRVGFLYIDTGAMYRAIALKALENQTDPTDSETISNMAYTTDIRFNPTETGLQVFCDNREVTEAIRSPEVSAATSPIADNPNVRKRLVALQQKMGKDGGVVMEGRDITTVVFPDAEIQIYLDANPKVRAERRYKELVEKGKTVTFEQTLTDLMKRDRRDRTRPVGALTISEQARIVDTTHLTQDQVVEQLHDIVLDYMSKSQD